MPDRLTEIRARLDAATPGPWLHEPTGDGWLDISKRVVTGRDPGGDDAFVPFVVGTCDDHFGNNAEFIAHAPADIAWLLEEVEQWKRVAEHRKRALSRTCTVCGRSVSECGND